MGGEKLSPRIRVHDPVIGAIEGGWIAELEEMFRPFVQPLVAKAVEEVARNPLSKEELEAVTLFAKMLKKQLDTSDEPSETLDQSIVKKETTAATRVLVRSWLNLLLLAGRATKQIAVDDTMCPVPQDERCKHIPASMRCHGLQEPEVVNIFHQVKMAHAAQTPLPEPARLFLTGEGISVVYG